MKFKEWFLKEGSNPGGKTLLYPLGYAGIGLYPPSWYLTRTADAIFYLSRDKRIYKGIEGPPFNIKNLPGSPPTSLNNGEGGMWNIKKFKL